MPGQVSPTKFPRAPVEPRKTQPFPLKSKKRSTGGLPRPSRKAPPWTILTSIPRFSTPTKTSKAKTSWPPSTSGSAAAPTHTCPSCQLRTHPNQHHNCHLCQLDQAVRQVKLGRFTWAAEVRGQCFLNLVLELYHRMTQRWRSPFRRRGNRRIPRPPSRRGASGSSSSSAAISLSLRMIWRQRSTNTSSTFARVVSVGGKRFWYGVAGCFNSAP